MKNLIIVTFNEESKAYEALSKTKSYIGRSTILTAGLIKNENGNVIIKDGYNHDDYGSNWAAGGLIGGLIGIIGGPVGVLLSGSLGALVGLGVDADKVDTTDSVIQEVLSGLNNYSLALLMIVEETRESELNELLENYDVDKMIRKEFVEVQAEIYEAEELQKSLEKQAKKEFRKERKEKWIAKAEAAKETLDNRFDSLKK